VIIARLNGLNFMYFTSTFLRLPSAPQSNNNVNTSQLFRSTAL
jgi:hypothetical protein